MTQSLRTEANTGFDCVAVFELPTLTGILDDMCETDEECRTTGNSDEATEIVFSELFGLPNDGTKQWVRLDYMDAMGWCGEPKISLHKDSSAPHTSTTLPRVRSDLRPCVTGTGRAAVNSLFSLESGRIAEREGSRLAYH